MGLHESFTAIWSQILAMELLPTVGKAYSILSQAKKRRFLQMIPNTPDVATLAVGHPLGSQDTRGVEVKIKEKCEHCGAIGHNKAHYFELIEYPPNWNRQKQFMQRQGANTYARSRPAQVHGNASSAVLSVAATTCSRFQGLTAAQYKQLLSLPSVDSSSTSTNLAG
ncbi:uncharacterized protein LOC110007629 [Amborella trichopoda]|nr:uncharacterized protein LOC110007629 [Amborella trichopoda]|eukprot:XP_020525528.1 uncharacterized protein LOC110007629 [Amborella trichopoda]